MKECYKPKTFHQKIGYLVEECGEVVQAVGKSMRWGLESVNPELPPEKQVTNRQWILNELKDLAKAVRMARYALENKEDYDEGKEGQL